MKTDVRDRLPRLAGHGARAAAAPALFLLLASCGGGSGGGGSQASSAATSAGLTTQPPAARSTKTPATNGRVNPTAIPLSPRKQVPFAVRAVLASADPVKACKQFVTPQFVATTYGNRQGCIQAQVPAAAARSVAVSDVEIHGRVAKAVVVPTGGPSDGERITAHLLIEGSVWKLNSLRSNAPVGP
jgi:hypothetical protein